MKEVAAMTRDHQPVDIAGATVERQDALDNRTALGLPRLIDAETVAEYLGTSVRHIRRLVDERRIPFVKVGRHVRFDVDEVSAWVDDHRVGVFRREPASTVGRYYGG
jgi:excisionase family DNA binding protein